MDNNDKKFKFYNEEEIKKILSDNIRLVYADDGIEEVIIRYDDIPDYIVDYNRKLGFGKDLTIDDFENPDWSNPLITTKGQYLDKCHPDVYKDIIDRLNALQQYEIDIKDYKIIDGYLLGKVMNQDEELER